MNKTINGEALAFVAKALGVCADELTDITTLERGMTNRSFLLACRGKRYILRVPGEGTDKLIDRANEAAVYRLLRNRGIADDVVAIDPDNGYKLTAYWENARVCDARSAEDVRRCMNALRVFHGLRLRVGHTFDLFAQIGFYEGLRGEASRHPDYAETKAGVLALRPYIERYAKPYALTHIDAVPDNFLFVGDEVRLIDWEYAAMQDPDVDLAMFAIYAMYDRPEIDALLAAYYTEGCAAETRAKIYACVAAGGLLWSNWCEYRHSLGVEFGGYARRQYEYAREYAQIAMGLFEEAEG